MSEIDLVVQLLHRLEEKVDAQSELITHNTLGQRRLLEKLDVRVVKLEKDVHWHRNWIAGSTAIFGGICGTLASWLWYHVTKLG